MYFFLDAFVVIYTPLSWCNRGESNLVSKDKWGVEKKWGGQGDDGVRRSTEFDSSSCQRCCIIDVPRIYTVAEILSVSRHVPCSCGTLTAAGVL